MQTCMEERAVERSRVMIIMMASGGRSVYAHGCGFLIQHAYLGVFVIIIVQRFFSDTSDILLVH